jgi:hypothetical protein
MSYETNYNYNYNYYYYGETNVITITLIYLTIYYKSKYYIIIIYMNDKIRNTLLIVCVVIVLLIFVDLVFNFTGIMVEKFQNNEEVSLENGNINSIVSKQDGRIFNIVFVSPAGEEANKKTICISSPTKSNSNISKNTDGTLGEKPKDSGNLQQRFTIHHITQESDYETLINDELGAHTSSINYPFYIIVPYSDTGQNKQCLTYEPGRLFLSNSGNYSNQRWDVSKQKNMNISVLTHDVADTSLGALNNAATTNNGEIYDPNKIKINLNLTDELKKQLFGASATSTPGGGGSGSGSSKCGTQISKDAISSLCGGCPVDKL